MSAGLTDLTIEKLLESMYGVQRLPPYYRVSPSTFNWLRDNLSDKARGAKIPDSLMGTLIRSDESVSDGKILPPEGWEP